MTRIACLGECMVELVEQPDGLLRRGFGGDTLNTAIYLARHGMGVDYVTALGDDPFSDDMIAAWQSEGVGTRLVLRVPGALPGLYLIQADVGGERRFSYWRDGAPVRRLFSLEEMAGVEAGLVAHDLLYLSGITLSPFQPLSHARLLRLLDAHRARGGRVAFDTNFRTAPGRTATPRVPASRTCSPARISIGGARGLDAAPRNSGRAGRAGRSATAPSSRDRAETVRTRVHPTGRYRNEAEVPAQSVTAITDTTAAGDSSAAAYIAARSTGCDPVEAARRGHRLAAIVITHRGALIPRSAMPA